MSRTTTAIWVIFMGVGGGMICRVSLSDMSSSSAGDRGLQLVENPAQVAGRVGAVVDRAPADHDVRAPAGHLGCVAQGHPAVHAHLDADAQPGGQFADRAYPARRVRG